MRNNLNNKIARIVRRAINEAYSEASKYEPNLMDVFRSQCNPDTLSKVLKVIDSETRNTYNKVANDVIPTVIEIIKKECYEYFDVDMLDHDYDDNSFIIRALPNEVTENLSEDEFWDVYDILQNRLDSYKKSIDWDVEFNVMERGVYADIRYPFNQQIIKGLVDYISDNCYGVDDSYISFAMDSDN